MITKAFTHHYCQKIRSGSNCVDRSLKDGGATAILGEERIVAQWKTGAQGAGPISVTGWCRALSITSPWTSQKEPLWLQLLLVHPFLSSGLLAERLESRDPFLYVDIAPI